MAKKKTQEINEQAKREISCKNCKYCIAGAYNCGKWYCKNPIISVFNPPRDIEKCFEKKGSVKE